MPARERRAATLKNCIFLLVVVVGEEMKWIFERGYKFVI